MRRGMRDCSGGWEEKLYCHYSEAEGRGSSKQLTNLLAEYDRGSWHLSGDPVLKKVVNSLGRGWLFK